MSYERTRQQGGFTRTPCSEWARNINCFTPNWFYNAAGPNAVSGGTYSEMRDVTVPNYHARVKKGEIFNNPFSSITRSYSVSAGGGWLVRTATVPSCATNPTLRSEYRSEGPYLQAWLPLETVAGIPVPKLQYAASNSDLDQICTEASTKVMSKRGSGSMWETVAELGKTAQMFAGPVSKYAKLLSEAERAFRLGRFTRTTTEGSMKAWLSWRYGIRPILLDIDNIMENLKKQLGEKRETTRAMAQGTAQTTVTGSAQVGVINTTWQCQVVDVMTVRAWSLDDYTLDALNQFGFTVKGFLTLPWELTPWSLVADWFVNFGDFLGAIAPAVGWKQLSSGLTVSHVTSNVYTPKVSVCTNPAYLLILPVTGSVAITHLAKQRRPLYSPGLVVKSDFRFDHFTRAADALSFAGQLTNKVFSPRKGPTKLI